MVQSEQPTQTDSINYKILILIFAGIILLQTAIILLDDSALVDSISQITALVSSLSVAIASFVIAKRYKGSVSFSNVINQELGKSLK